MTISFFKSSAEQMNACAAYVAQLIKEQVSFQMKDLSSKVEVTLTGGF